MQSILNMDSKGNSLLKKQKGITLIELLITIVIIAVLVIIGIPSFVNYLQENRLIGTTQNLYYTLQYARSEAVKRNTTMYVVFQTGSNWCYGINPGSSCSCSTAGSCTLGSVSSNSAQPMSLSTSGLTSNTIQFEPLHGASYISGTITYTLTGSSNAMSVKVNLLGSLQVCSNQISGYPTCS